jgi:hypothetical protein
MKNFGGGETGTVHRLLEKSDKYGGATGQKVIDSRTVIEGVRYEIPIETIQSDQATASKSPKKKENNNSL